MSASRPSAARASDEMGVAKPFTTEAAEYVADTCHQHYPWDSRNAQLCVLSRGMDLFRVAARMILRRRAERPPGLYVVLVAETLRPAAVDALVAGLRSTIEHLQAVAATAAVSVAALPEGTSVKERSAAYAQGGVVVSSGRFFCADLLHRRLSVDLVRCAIVVFPSWAYALGSLGGGGVGGSGTFVSPNLALCAEVLLRESAEAAPMVFLTDHPLVARCLAERRYVGVERFMQCMRIGDVQLFPRFRLDIMQHYEALTARAPLKVGFTEIQCGASEALLDSVLVKIVEEIMEEIRRRTVPADGQSPGCQHGQRRPREEEADDASGEIVGLLLPRAQPRYEDSTHTVHYAAHPPHSHAPKQRQDAAAGDGASEGRLSLAMLTREACVDYVHRNALDAELLVLLHANAPTWSMRPLLESLLDVRRLRRQLRTLSGFDFIFALTRALMHHAQRAPDGVLTPSLPWTLSSRVSDLIAVATQRIGTFGTAGSGGSSVIDVDDSGDTTSSGPHAAVFIPSAGERDDAAEVMHRFVASWVRRAPALMRKSGKDESLLVVTAGWHAQERLLQRLTHTRDGYDFQQVNSFIRRYRFRDGQQGDAARRHQARGQPPTDGEGATTARQRYGAVMANLSRDAAAADGSAPDSDDDGSGDDCSSLPGEGGRMRGARAADAGGSDDDADDGDGDDSFSGGSDGEAEYLLALTQAAAPNKEGQVSWQDVLQGRAAVTAVKSDGPAAAVALPLAAEMMTERLCVLSARFDTGCYITRNSAGSGGGGGPTARVLLLNSQTLCVADVCALLDGRHPRLSHVGFSGPEPNALAPIRRVMVAGEDLRFLRLLEQAQEALPADTVAALRVQVVTAAPTQADVRSELAAERDAFQALGKAKAAVVATLLMDNASRFRASAALDGANLLLRNNRQRRRASAAAGAAARGCGGGGSAARLGADDLYSGGGDGAPSEAVEPLVVFDERELRSELPHALYEHGLALVPLTLRTADYVLSPRCGVERKGVRDYVSSLLGQRIHAQLTALSRRYQLPLLLIEFSRLSPFRLTFVPQTPLPAPRAGRARRAGAKGVHVPACLYSLTVRMLLTHPRVCVVWSRSPMHSAALMATLKRTVAVENVDPKDETLTSADVDDDEGGGGGAADARWQPYHHHRQGGMVAASAQGSRPSDATVYARRVLACFPGVNPANSAALMQECGSLAGLATIAKEALLRVMEPEDADKLYAFLHNPIAEHVD